MPKPPTLPSGKPFKERLLLYGPPKIGKTDLFLQIARWHQDMGSDAMFYIISSDMGVEPLLFGDRFGGLANIDHRDVSTMQEFIDVGREFKSIARPQDWVCSDLQDDAWSFAQDEYAAATTAAKGGSITDMGDLWSTKGPGDKYPIEGWDWGMPNARYRVFTNNILLRMPCHVVMIEREAEVMSQSRSGSSDEDPKIKAMFGHVGMKPKGQKEDPFRFHSIIRVEAGRIDGGHIITNKLTTAGDRVGGRRWMGRKMRNGSTMGEEIEDFPIDYLVKVAGWEM